MKEIEVKTKRPKLISKPGLRDRGWTDTMIQRYLPIHDAEKANPYYKCAAPMKLYMIDRIIKIEKRKSFMEMLAKSKERKALAQKAVTTKIDKVREFANSIDIDIPLSPKDQLIWEACNSYNDHKEYQAILNGYDRDWHVAGPHSDDAFLARICQNYLRHNCTDYDDMLDKLFGKVGVSVGHDIIKKRINDRIRELYPWIKENLS